MKAWIPNPLEDGYIRPILMPRSGNSSCLFTSTDDEPTNALTTVKLKRFLSREITFSPPMDYSGGLPQTFSLYTDNKAGFNLDPATKVNQNPVLRLNGQTVLGPLLF